MVISDYIKDFDGEIIEAFTEDIIITVSVNMLGNDYYNNHFFSNNLDVISFDHVFHSHYFFIFLINNNFYSTSMIQGIIFYDVFYTKIVKKGKDKIYNLNVVNREIDGNILMDWEIIKGIVGIIEI